MDDVVLQKDCEIAELLPESILSLGIPMSYMGNAKNNPNHIFLKFCCDADEVQQCVVSSSITNVSEDVGSNSKIPNSISSISPASHDFTSNKPSTIPVSCDNNLNSSNVAPNLEKHVSSNNNEYCQGAYSSKEKSFTGKKNHDESKVSDESNSLIPAVFSSDDVKCSKSSVQLSTFPKNITDDPVIEISDPEDNEVSMEVDEGLLLSNTGSNEPIITDEVITDQKINFLKPVCEDPCSSNNVPNEVHKTKLSGDFGLENVNSCSNKRMQYLSDGPSQSPLRKKIKTENSHIKLEHNVTSSPMVVIPNISVFSNGDESTIALTNNSNISEKMSLSDVSAVDDNSTKNTSDAKFSTFSDSSICKSEKHSINPFDLSSINSKPCVISLEKLSNSFIDKMISKQPVVQNTIENSIEQMKEEHPKAFEKLKRKAPLSKKCGPKSKTNSLFGSSRNSGEEKVSHKHSTSSSKTNHSPASRECVLNTLSGISASLIDSMSDDSDEEISVRRKQQKRNNKSTSCLKSSDQMPSTSGIRCTSATDLPASDSPRTFDSQPEENKKVLSCVEGIGKSQKVPKVVEFNYDFDDDDLPDINVQFEATSTPIVNKFVRDNNKQVVDFPSPIEASNTDKNIKGKKDGSSNDKKYDVSERLSVPLDKLSFDSLIEEDAEDNSEVNKKSTCSLEVNSCTNVAPSENVQVKTEKDPFLVPEVPSIPLAKIKQEVPEIPESPTYEDVDEDDIQVVNYSQVDDYILLSSDEEELICSQDVGSNSFNPEVSFGPMPSSPDLSLDDFFNSYEDSVLDGDTDRVTYPIKQADENLEALSVDTVEGDMDVHSWFPQLSQGFYEGDDEVEEELPDDAKMHSTDEEESVASSSSVTKKHQPLEDEVDGSKSATSEKHLSDGVKLKTTVNVDDVFNDLPDINLDLSDNLPTVDLNPSVSLHDLGISSLQTKPPSKSKPFKANEPLNSSLSTSSVAFDLIGAGKRKIDKKPPERVMKMTNVILPPNIAKKKEAIDRKGKDTPSSSKVKEKGLNKKDKKSSKTPGVPKPKTSKSSSNSSLRNQLKKNYDLSNYKALSSATSKTSSVVSSSSHSIPKDHRVDVTSIKEGENISVVKQKDDNNASKTLTGTAKMTRKNRSIALLTEVSLFPSPPKTKPAKKNLLAKSVTNIPETALEVAKTSEKAAKTTKTVSMTDGELSKVTTAVIKTVTDAYKSEDNNDSSTSSTAERAKDLVEDDHTSVPMEIDDVKEMEQKDNEPTIASQKTFSQRIPGGILKIPGTLKNHNKNIRFPDDIRELEKIREIPPRKDKDRMGPSDVNFKELAAKSIGFNSLSPMNSLTEGFGALSTTSISPFYLNQYYFIQKVCTWNYDWLKQYQNAQLKTFGPPKPPPLLGKKSLVFPTLVLYSSFKDYFEVFSILFFYEAWEGIYKDWVKFHATNVWFSCEVDTVNHNFVPPSVNVIANKQETSLVFTSVKMITLLTQMQDRQALHPRSGSLVCIKVPVQNKSTVMFGYVSEQMKMPHTMVSKKLKDANPQGTATLMLTVLISKASASHITQSCQLNVCNISYLKPNIRIWDGLTQLQNSPLGPLVLAPTIQSMTLPPSIPDYIVPEIHLNQSQCKAVASVTSSVLCDPVPRICLIHGPPGTGKTKTLVALVSQIYRRARLSKFRSCVLLCAPSNAAVDELTRRLIALNSVGINLNVVRCGNPGRKGNIDRIIQSRSYDVLVEKGLKLFLERYVEMPFVFYDDNCLSNAVLKLKL